MKRFLQNPTWMLSGCLFAFVACVWAWSYLAPHSLRYGWASGEIQVLTDKGIFQVDVVRGDTKARGFEWDSHRRSVAWGREDLDMFKPKAGIGKLLADLGFASRSYDRIIQWLDPTLPGRVVFIPIWFCALVVVLPLFIQLVIAPGRRRSCWDASPKTCGSASRPARRNPRSLPRADTAMTFWQRNTG